MENRNTGPARALAALALAAAFIAVVFVFASTMGGDDGTTPQAGSGSGGGAATGRATLGGGKGKAPTSYVVQNGDTLTSIAAKTGVSIERIQALNPGVDPQILVSGEKLKLR